MKRYHKDIYFNREDKGQLDFLIEYFNNLNTYGKTKHGLDRIKECLTLLEILEILENLKLKFKNLFEYYKNEAGKIEKLCFRIPYNTRDDLIIVLSDEKALITIYLNNKFDNHDNLKRELYARV